MTVKGAGHYSARKGKRVFVLMRDGHHFVAKFHHYEGKYVYFSDHEQVATAKIRTLSNYKGTPKSGEAST